MDSSVIQKEEKLVEEEKLKEEENLKDEGKLKEEENLKDEGNLKEEENLKDEGKLKEEENLNEEEKLAKQSKQYPARKRNLTPASFLNQDDNNYEPVQKKFFKEFDIIKSSNYEELFPNRYTATDEDYINNKKIEVIEPICIFPWYNNKSAPHYNNNRQYNNNGRYNNNQNQRRNYNRGNTKKHYNNNNYGNSNFQRK